jgi:hypothetical protein
MSTEYQIQPNSRRCAVTGRELQPGERYYSALVEEGTQLLRRDFCHEAWTGPPTGAFSFWTGRVPPPQQNARPRFDDDLLEECFHRLENSSEPSRINFRYVVTLLLLRRKRLKLEQTVTEDGVETLTVRSTRDGNRSSVVNPRLTEEEMRQVQEEVFQVLGWT